MKNAIQVSETPVAVAGTSYQREKSWMSVGLVPFSPTQNSAGMPGADENTPASKKKHVVCDYSACIRCYCCHEMCPVNAIHVENK